MDKFKIFAARTEDCMRNFDEKPHEIRSEFDRDRDRILYSKAFRRLSGKTQVFVVGNDDHIRTRLTHTLEVAQISNTISKYLGMNVTLAEAISLGHDIGHTPFGHVGERTLNNIMNGCYLIKNFNNNLNLEDKGFKHNWQGLRVVSELEQLKKGYCGLNLTNYTMWGILNHSKIKYKQCNKRNTENKCNLLLYGRDCNNGLNGEVSIGFYNKYSSCVENNSWTIEGLIVSMADEISQRHHDIEDGIEAKLINVTELVNIFKSYFNDFLNEDERNLIDYIENERDKIYYLPALSKLIVNFLTFRLIRDTSDNLARIKKEFDIETVSDFLECKYIIKENVGLENIVSYSQDFKLQEEKFQEYLRNRILNSHKAQSMDGKADFIIRKLFKAYITNPQQLPDKTIITIYKNLLSTDEFEVLERENSIEALTGLLRDKLQKNHFNTCENSYKAVLLRVICDYISGMTDNYAIKQYSQLYGSEKAL